MDPILKKSNNKLHAEICSLKSVKDRVVTQEIHGMRMEIEANTRKIREIEYLKRVDGRTRQLTLDYIDQL